MHRNPTDPGHLSATRPAPATPNARSLPRAADAASAGPAVRACLGFMTVPASAHRFRCSFSVGQPHVPSDQVSVEASGSSGGYCLSQRATETPTRRLYLPA